MRNNVIILKIRRSAEKSLKPWKQSKSTRYNLQIARHPRSMLVNITSEANVELVKYQCH